MKKYYYRFKLWLEFLNPNMDISKYYDLEVKAGYKASDGSPLVCYDCGHKNFKMGKHYTEEVGLVEYELLCCKCNNEVGYWAYGNWQR